MQGVHRKGHEAAKIPAVKKCASYNPFYHSPLLNAATWNAHGALASSVWKLLTSLVPVVRNTTEERSNPQMKERGLKQRQRKGCPARPIHAVRMGNFGGSTRAAYCFEWANFQRAKGSPWIPRPGDSYHSNWIPLGCEAGAPAPRPDSSGEGGGGGRPRGPASLTCREGGVALAARLRPISVLRFWISEGLTQA